MCSGAPRRGERTEASIWLRYSSFVLLKAASVRVKPGATRLQLAARKMKMTLPAGTAIDAEVDLCNTDGAYFLQARLNVNLPGLESELAQALVDAAHQMWLYSKATRGNIDVTINVVTQGKGLSS